MMPFRFADVSERIRDFIAWKPISAPERRDLLFSGCAAVGGLLMLVGGLLYFNSLLLSLTSILFGLPFCIVSTWLLIRQWQFLIFARQVHECLTDGHARYLMPGAFTHVLVHPDLERQVILAKRGERALRKFVGRSGPRQTSAGEWQMYRRMKDHDICVSTWRVGVMQIEQIAIDPGANLQLAAVKGEERLMADRLLHDTIDIYVQRRGKTLADWITTKNVDKHRIYSDFRALVHRMWRAGFIDLDVAFRNYLVLLDEEGQPLQKGDRYQVACHDFGCVFDLPEGRDAIEHFLSSRGFAGEVKAAVTNGGFLIRCLLGRREREFAPHLFPELRWNELLEVFHPEDDDGMDLPTRLKHHTNYKLLRNSYSLIAQLIDQVAAGARRRGKRTQPRPVRPRAKARRQATRPGRKTLYQ